jgi:putative ABC transport system permease protein
MAIPLSYNLRNLAVRRTTTLLTALGIGLTVAVLLAALALVEGLRSAFQSSGSLRNILVLRKGASAELGSVMTREIFETMRFHAGVAHAADGDQPMASLEIVTTVNLPSVDRPAGSSVTLRGLLPVGLEMRNLKLQAGRWFQAGQREIVVGKSVAQRFPGAHPGGRLSLGKGEWEVVGVMDAGRSAVNSELFGDLNQVSSDFNRSDFLSSVLLRAVDVPSVPALVNVLNDDPRLNVFAQTERAYYDRQSVSGQPLLNLGILVSITMAVGSSFAAMNTMYAAVTRRAPEIGTLRVLGFSRDSILVSFLIESVLLAGLGGVIGCILALPLNFVTSAVGNSITLSETAFRFRVSPSILLAGIVFALLMGAIGGLLPARMAANKEILTALREI